MECREKVTWMLENGGTRGHPTGHAYNHSAPPRGDYCFWCGQHRDDGTSQKPEAEGYTWDHYWDDVIYQEGL